MFTASVESIAECKKSDIPELVELTRKTYAQTYPGLFTPKRLSEIFTAAQFEKDLADSNCCIRVARRRGCMIGYVKAILNIDAMLIDKIYVIEKMKGNGWGVRLIQACVELAIAKKIYNAKVFVFDTNLTVKSFYEKFGFRENGEKEPYFNNGKLVGYDHVMVCDDLRKYFASTLRVKL